MWCYHKPGFETLLLAGLQRQQQQRSQFCDTLLKAEGVSVPAHSCVLSAISPQVSSALLSSPAPPAGQSRMLEFQALGACTLLHMVRLLYSGEMAGEGEREKEEAISAAANLGIQGLVEVTKRDQSGRNEMGGGGGGGGAEGGQHAEVGVQTEPSIFQEARVEWRRASRDGKTFLWKKSLSHDEKDTWTQTEAWQVNTAPPAHSAASLEPNNMVVMQDGAQSDSQLFNPQIPYIPVSVVYTPENHINQLSFPTTLCIQDPTADGGTQTSVPFPQCVPSCSTACSVHHNSWVIAPQVAARDEAEGEEWQEEQIEEFQDNIPGFIKYFLNPEQKKGARRGRGGRRGRRARAGIGRRARTSRTSTRRGGKGGWMQTVDVQNTGVSKLQKKFLHRWGGRSSRAGQGGGAAGRKLCLKSREVLKKDKSTQKRRRSNKSEFEENGETMSCKRSRGNCRGKRDSPLNKDHQRTRAKSASLSFTPALSYCSYNLPSSSVQPRLCPVLLSPPPPYNPPASSLLHTTCLPPLAPLPEEDQPEQIDRLLEEVMMGLDIIPNNSRSGTLQFCPTSRRSNSCTYGSSDNELSQKTQPEPSSVVLRAGAGFDGSHVAVAAKVPSGSNSTPGEEPVLQQQGEGELNMMLDRFLQSFEQQIDSCKTGAEMEEGSSETQTMTPDSDHPHNTHAPHLDTPSGTTASPQSSVHGPASAKQAEKIPKKVKKPRRRRRRKGWGWAVRSKIQAMTKVHQYTQDLLLQQVPVVRLTKHSLSVRVTLQEENRQSLEEQSPTKPNCTPSESPPNDDLPEKNRLWGSAIYPLRSRLRKAETATVFQDGVHLHPEKKHRSPPSEDPEEACRTAKQSEEREERSDGDLKKPRDQIEGAAVTGRKRREGSENKRYDAATEAKRICLEAAVFELPSDTCAVGVGAADTLSERPTVEAEGGGDEGSISLVREEGEAREKETKKSLTGEEVKSNEINSAGGDPGGEAELKTPLNKQQAPLDKDVVTPPLKEESTMSYEDEDIDVIGGSSPLPRVKPETICWSVSSEAEDEEQDVEVV